MMKFNKLATVALGGALIAGPLAVALPALAQSPEPTASQAQAGSIASYTTVSPQELTFSMKLPADGNYYFAWEAFHTLSGASTYLEANVTLKNGAVVEDSSGLFFSYEGFLGAVLPHSAFQGVKFDYLPPVEAENIRWSFYSKNDAGVSIENLFADTGVSPDPTGDPTTDPTDQPTGDPTGDPTTDPTTDPTDQPTTDPTGPTEEPTTPAPTESATTPAPSETPTTPAPTESQAPMGAAIKLPVTVDADGTLHGLVADFLKGLQEAVAAADMEWDDVTFEIVDADGKAVKDVTEFYSSYGLVTVDEEAGTITVVPSHAGEALPSATYRLIAGDGRTVEGTIAVFDSALPQPTPSDSETPTPSETPAPTATETPYKNPKADLTDGGEDKTIDGGAPTTEGSGAILLLGSLVAAGGAAVGARALRRAK